MSLDTSTPKCSEKIRSSWALQVSHNQLLAHYVAARIRLATFSHANNRMPERMLAEQSLKTSFSTGYHFVCSLYKRAEANVTFSLKKCNNSQERKWYARVALSTRQCAPLFLVLNAVSNFPASIGSSNIVARTRAGTENRARDDAGHFPVVDR